MVDWKAEAFVCFWQDLAKSKLACQACFCQILPEKGKRAPFGFADVVLKGRQGEQGHIWQRWVHKHNRQSPIVLSIGTVILLSSAFVLAARLHLSV